LRLSLADAVAETQAPPDPADWWKGEDGKPLCDD
jgi:hypothetical protein